MLFIVSICLFSCKDDDDTGSLNIQFKLYYDGVPLKMFTNYTYPSGEKFYFSRFSFFTSEIQLQDSKGQYSEILDVKYHDLTNNHTGGGSDYKFIIDGIKAGTYKSIKIGIGVPPNANSKTPAQYGSDNPLSNQSEYWGGWESYIFTRTEGQIDFDGDDVPETGFALHTGADDAYRILEIPVDVTVGSNNPDALFFEIDLKSQFGENPIYDIKQNPQIHSLAQQPQVIELMNNLITGIKAKTF